MDRKELKIVYMATADFALPALQRLVEGGYNVRAVVTMPDKPAGRGLKLQESNIKKYAVAQGIEVLQPVRLKDPDFVQRLTDIAPDLGIVVAFRMLPEVVWSLPRLGTINLHGSLLPKYRGAAPIHWAVIRGERETGVTTFRLKHELDTGDIILQASTPISPSESTGEVYERLMSLGAETLQRTVDLFLAGEAAFTPQCSVQTEPSDAPKLTKDNTRIDWHQPASVIHDFVRGLCPFPSAWAELQIEGVSEPIVCKVHAVQVAEPTEQHEGKPMGSVVLGRKTLDVVCADGVVRILQLQPAGKRAMAATDFINGLR